MPGSTSDNPWAALGPVEWDALDHDRLVPFLADTFASAQTLLASIPGAADVVRAAAPATAGGRARSRTDGAVTYNVQGDGVNNRDNTGDYGDYDDDPGNDSEPTKGVARQQPPTQAQAWKEMRVGGGSSVNPHGIAVYKMRDGRDGYRGSSWFARRSVHHVEAARGRRGPGAVAGVSFDAFRRSLQKEFAISAEPTNEDGIVGTKEEDDGTTTEETKKVRTMEAKKRLEHVVVGRDGPSNGNIKDPVGQIDVYLLEAVFPKPTAPRDFVTMLLTSSSSHASSSSSPAPSATTAAPSAPRQFMLVSRPCRHPACPPRPGFVRAEYESVEMIREIPLIQPAEAAKTNTTNDGRDGRGAMAVEWLMITRNDPGGNVPRFLVDRSTPSSIISDANKFLEWVATREAADVVNKRQSGEREEAGSRANTDTKSAADVHMVDGEGQNVQAEGSQVGDVDDTGAGGPTSSTKLYNLLAGVLGAAGTAVASSLPSLPNPFEGAIEVLRADGDHKGAVDNGSEKSAESDDGMDSDAYDSQTDRDADADGDGDNSSVSEVDSVSPVSVEAGPESGESKEVSSLSITSSAAGNSKRGAASKTAGEDPFDAKMSAATSKAGQAALKRHEKELRKLQERLRKAEGRLLKAKNVNKVDLDDTGSGGGRGGETTIKDDAASSASSESAASDASVASAASSAAAASSSDSSVDALHADIRKLRTKHEEAVARQQARYRKEVQALERKHQQQADKAAARARKQRARAAKADAVQQLARVQAERDVARKEAELRTEQVRQLQAQNTALVARLGRLTKQAHGNGLGSENDDSLKGLF
ncbi:START-like domain protein [Niveomyces insectorum RCEF 264]|uniref:START-like domain protein n=1 Tax=Niveomyces insectorum RCEF 264 TaxID=1081102 RepID=A0A168A4Q0_9HYPO|nr:START-like domain protein [Niveomyces insectorum RCEF 264]